MGVWYQIDLAYQSDASPFFQCLLGYEYPVWLDSCAHAGCGRYDVITAAPYETLVLQSQEDKLTQETDFLAKLKEKATLTSFQLDEISFSGVIGFFSYEFGVRQAGISCLNPSRHGMPEAWFGFYAWAIITDHHLKKTVLIYCDEPNDDALSIKKLCNLWQRLDQTSHNFLLKDTFQSNISYEAYQKALADIQHHLRCGNTYQVNYSHCFSAAFEGEPFTAYMVLRQTNPSEFAAFMRLPFGDVLSFSPELLVRANEEHLLTKPIKGTAARVFDEKQDQKIIQTLKRCPKNRAENTMIVDLLRNDLSKVAKFDSVEVKNYLDIEIMPSVFHLVSTISAELDMHFDYFDVLKALLPGGSITGAPKHSTMKIIEDLEHQARGVYCGSIGHLSDKSNMCFNIAIRTITAAKGRLFCNAGGGIVLDSSVDAEYQETFDKVAVLTKTLQQY